MKTRNKLYVPQATTLEVANNRRTRIAKFIFGFTTSGRYKAYPMKTRNKLCAPQADALEVPNNRRTQIAKFILGFTTSGRYKADLLKSETNPASRVRRLSAATSGFTLFEILVSVTILAIAFTSLFQIFGGSLRSIEISQKYSRAVTLGEEMMTEILFDDENFQVRSDEGVFEKNPGYSYELNITPYEKSIGRIEENREEITGVKPVTYRTKIVVRWREGARERFLTLETLKTILEGVL